MSDRYQIKRNGYLVLLTLLPIVAAGIAEMLSIVSSSANSTYAISSLQTVMILTEISIAILIGLFVASFYFKGRIAMYIFDALRLAAVVMLCICFYTVLAERATLMGYVWFSDLESGNLISVSALNYGVAAAAVYAAAILLIAATGVIEYVDAGKRKRTEEEIRAEISALEEELKQLG